MSAYQSHPPPPPLISTGSPPTPTIFNVSISITPATTAFDINGVATHPYHLQCQHTNYTCLHCHQHQWDPPLPPSMSAYQSHPPPLSSTSTGPTPATFYVSISITPASTAFDINGVTTHPYHLQLSPPTPTIFNVSILITPASTTFNINGVTTCPYHLQCLPPTPTTFDVSISITHSTAFDINGVTTCPYHL
ncbi:hypothetical protein BDQ12DRAFT_725382 [Crucibulum laeve]|uniref:Uncharacterized protein n=1 Tax=Crucibulum laeve TaxID=68775 RepID=A0A5C3M4P2_9AGAR|nr:hypothetical protein BDQ12DRAFT_725382 [Crucibulum laeve]